ncbi:MAG: Hsp20/alpha crystallin family protein [candidate division Zixibacteria bacterium]|nr:Hsp20/alpha crystallin family protein [Candidatus Tariuqbacter arcticus]
MNLVRFNPTRDLWKVRTDMDRLFNQLFSRTHEADEYPEVDWSPRLDIAENDSDFTINVELPGIKRDDITITLQDDVLTLKGEKRTGKDSKEHNYHLCERSYGKFVRSFRLPNYFDSEKIDASFKDGILILTLPKLAETKAKQIEIKAK